jgi:hypothetical protein
MYVDTHSTIKSTRCGNPFCTHVTDNDPPKPNKATILPSQIQLKLRTLGDEFEDRFRTQFDDMVDQLHITDITAYPTFHRVVHELFVDGNINWGRIVALFGRCGNPFCTHVTDNDPPKPNKATILPQFIFPSTNNS